MAAPSAAPSSKIKPSSSSIGTVPTRSRNRVPYAGVPSAKERTGDFGEVCSFYGGTFDATGLCSVPQGQIWDPYTNVFNPTLNGGVASAFIPFNNMATYTSPGNPKLAGTPFQPSNTPGNLIDPVAQKLMNLFPMAEHCGRHHL